MILWFRRLKRYFKAGTPAEPAQSSDDPVAMADELLSDMEQELSDMRQSLNKQIAAEKRLKRRLETARAESAEREKDAVGFLENNDEYSARLALIKKEETDRHVEEIKSLYQAANSHKEELHRHIEEHMADYERLQRKKNELQAKRNFYPSSAVNEIELAKKQGSETAVNHTEAIPPEGEQDYPEKNRTGISAPADEAGVDAKLEALKKSLKRRN
ncbi:PspA/IM30 family protein [Salipaludibacillus aurantiacus]|uniref:PspA/IM30 family protein n=1 Tax=Salipaludibacillus aurantiacus TaxID=1601833 RepID=A0A1H9W9C1_9BACI|nr:PspA/IM30 family protein [Salipaludibacillus aurantiacus]SES30414.1 PspA/IM30 family protein [Salipaludibacillus aurantiacus]